MFGLVIPLFEKGGAHVHWYVSRLAGMSDQFPAPCATNNSECFAFESSNFVGRLSLMSK